MDQQPMSYSVNRERAIKASGNLRIAEKGGYTGTLIRAEATVSSKGTVGIDFTFRADDGATADFLTIWTHKANGEELSGFGLIDALLTCIGFNGKLDAKRGRIEKYNPDSGLREVMDAILYPDLMNKPIGLLLVVEEYLNTRSNQIKSKMLIQGFYAAASGKTAKEIWEKAPAKALPLLIAGLRDKPYVAKPGATPAMRSTGSRPDAGHPAFDDFADDIPF